MNKYWKYVVIAGVFFVCLSFILLINNYCIDYFAGKSSKRVYDEIVTSLKNDEVLVNLDEMPIVTIDGYDFIGVIEIPALELKLPVMSDWNYEDMKLYPGRYYGSVYTNDLIICAHSYKSLFRDIKNLNNGDVLFFTDMNNELYIYEVELIEIISATDIDKMINNDFDLTLYTCINSNKDRVAIRLNKNKQLH